MVFNIFNICMKSQVYAEIDYEGYNIKNISNKIFHKISKRDEDVVFLDEEYQQETTNEILSKNIKNRYNIEVSNDFYNIPNDKKTIIKNYTNMRSNKIIEACTNHNRKVLELTSTGYRINDIQNATSNLNNKHTNKLSIKEFCHQH